MEVTRIHDGLWRWSIPGPDGCARASTYLEHGRDIILVDPVLPPPGDDLDRFHRAIDHDTQRLAGGVRILLTCSGHLRDSASLADRTGAVLWTPGDGDPPAGMVALPSGLVDEVALWSPVHRVLIVGHAVAMRDGRLVAAPGADVASMSLLAPHAIIPAHGLAIVTGAADALQRAARQGIEEG